MWLAEPPFSEPFGGTTKDTKSTKNSFVSLVSFVVQSRGPRLTFPALPGEPQDSSRITRQAEWRRHCSEMLLPGFPL